MKIPLKYKDYNTLTVEINYTKGGINYFTAGTDRRGIYCYVRPETIEEGFRSFIVGEERSYKFLLSEEQRLNRKKIEKFRAALEQLNGEELRELYLSGRNRELVEKVRAAVAA